MLNWRFEDSRWLISALRYGWDENWSNHGDYEKTELALLQLPHDLSRCVNCLLSFLWCTTRSGMRNAFASGCARGQRWAWEEWRVGGMTVWVSIYLLTETHGNGLGGNLGIKTRGWFCIYISTRGGYPSLDMKTHRCSLTRVVSWHCRRSKRLIHRGIPTAVASCWRLMLPLPWVCLRKIVMIYWCREGHGSINRQLSRGCGFPGFPSLFIMICWWHPYFLHTPTIFWIFVDGTLILRKHSLLVFARFNNCFHLLMRGVVEIID